MFTSRMAPISPHAQWQKQSYVSSRIWCDKDLLDECLDSHLGEKRDSLSSDPDADSRGYFQLRMGSCQASQLRLPAPSRDSHLGAHSWLCALKAPSNDPNHAGSIVPVCT